MAKITFSKLGLKPQKKVNSIKINDNITLEIKEYLPIEDKTKLIQYVVDSALDEATGCFSPVRTEVYFAIGICRWYGGITFTDKQLQDVMKTYDLLEENGINTLIMDSIPKSEISFMQDLINDTIKDISRYNSSAAGIIQTMSTNSSSLNDQISDILEKIKNGEGLEQLSVIKDMVGND